MHNGGASAAGEPAPAAPAAQSGPYAGISSKHLKSLDEMDSLDEEDEEQELFDGHAGADLSDVGVEDKAYAKRRNGEHNSNRRATDETVDYNMSQSDHSRRRGRRRRS